MRVYVEAHRSGRPTARALALISGCTRWTDDSWTPRRNLTGHLLIALRGEREQKSAALRDDGGGGGVGGGRRGGGGRGLHEMSREELIGWGRGGCRGYGVKTDPDVYIHSHCMWGGWEVEGTTSESQ